MTKDAAILFRSLPVDSVGIVVVVVVVVVLVTLRLLNFKKTWHKHGESSSAKLTSKTGVRGSLNVF